MSPNWIIGTLAIITVVLLVAFEILHAREPRRRHKDPAASVRPYDPDPQRRP